MMELLRSLTISDLKPFLAEPTQLNNQSIALQLAVASYSPTLGKWRVRDSAGGVYFMSLGIAIKSLR
ncbi:hypothetical protein H6G54_08625 [Anabaena cylindrica FACHB-243]|uniref:Uncharacterized protein n=1 Tax=Anabaena cylindrica (strain ATCC 27899 / PCC 7122) TaxID=272123 RepID=K9ZLV8_ANACC|nr:MULTISPECIES: hypothetical protein [Anabaena]AFZ60176.1 hypothetical protein Anacy_4833 [Anabaena cylindrica PCC 7122]MBD2417769.1 hypothetical protein [Anabaena cylindrica FACHB-243]MBY5285565.1 hypothetical protein [Anabaena sp. CCAP 1446/1C]MCM2404684.1 hypothetical protein [Anabaena sp. CCAP 1446/1C]BAY02756.1 hypothetical protein NIES19_20040 [Anabaena cylindrica PCC 7122]